MRRIVAHIGAGIDQPIAHTVLQRDAPLPARRARGRLRKRPELRPMFARHRHRAVAGQPMAPVIIGRAQDAFDQHGAKARTIDEQIGRQRLAGLQDDRVNMVTLTLACGIRHLTLDPAHAIALGRTAQKSSIEPGIEMIGRPHTGQPRLADPFDRRKPLLQSCGGVERIIVQCRGHTAIAPAKPVMMERGQPQRRTDIAECVEIALSFRAPAVELDAKLVAGFGGPQKIGFVEPEKRIDMANLRDRRLSHANRADAIRFHQRDRYLPSECLGQHGGGHPACGAAAQDQDRSDGIVTHHCPSSMPPHLQYAFPEMRQSWAIRTYR